MSKPHFSEAFKRDACRYTVTRETFLLTSRKLGKEMFIVHVPSL